jgi:hypothetical protein
MMMPAPDAQEPSVSPPVVEDSESLRPLPPGWETWLEDMATENLPPLDSDVFTVEAPPVDPPPDLANELALLNHRIEAAQEEMNSPDGWLRLDELLETRNQVADDFAIQSEPEPTNDLMDARFLQRADIADGQVVGGTVQYIEIYQSADNSPNGRVLDVGHYDSLLKTEEVYKELQGSADNGSLTLDDLPVLATELAEANGLLPDSWREATADDYSRYAEQSAEMVFSAEDIPPESVFSDEDFVNSLLLDFAASQEQAEEVQVRAALSDIGLSVPTELNLTRDSFYDAERDERLINGIFQRDMADPTQNCRPMFVSLSTKPDGNLSAQAVEFGRVGSFSEVQVDHNRVQSALEQDGVSAAITTIEIVEAEYSIADVNGLSAPEPSSWSREID